MLKQLKFSFLVLSIVFFAGCNLFDDPETEEEKLPKATQTGENTFGCLVDGKAWVTETSIDADAYYQEGRLSITAFLETATIDQTMRISLLDPDLQEAEYSLREYPDSFGRVRNIKNNCEYITSDTYMGSFIITHFDQMNFIISGTFEFEGYSDDCDEIIKVTKGRFDLTYAP